MGADRRDRLDRRRLNRALLARQHLLDRVSLPAGEVVEHLVGMQAQAPLAPYVGLWSRLTAINPEAVGATVAGGILVRTHAMRGTVHLFTRRDALALRPVMASMLACDSVPPRPRRILTASRWTM